MPGLVQIQPDTFQDKSQKTFCRFWKMISEEFLLVRSIENDESLVGYVQHDVESEEKSGRDKTNF